MKRRKRLYLSVGLALLTGLVMLVKLGAAPKGQLAVNQQAGPTVGHQPPVAKAKIVRARGPAPTPTTPLPKLPGKVAIESVDVDKTEVCRGAEVRVSVKATTDDGSDAYLNYEVLGRPDLVGNQFPMRVERSIGYGELTALVTGKNGYSDSKDLPPIMVKDCVDASQLRVGLRRSLDAMDRAWLSAVPVATGDGDGGAAPLSYEWDFGDGTRTTTDSARVEHSYEGRLQDSAFSYFFVNVTARDARGNERRGSRSLRFVNLGFTPLKSQQRVLIFAGRREDESGQEQIWLYHGAPFDVELVQATVATSAPADAQPSPETSHSALALLGIDRLPRATSVAVQNLDGLRPSEAGAEVRVTVIGKTRGGKLASGGFLLAAPDAELALHGVESEQTVN